MNILKRITIKKKNKNVLIIYSYMYLRCQAFKDIMLITIPITIIFKSITKMFVCSLQKQAYSNILKILPPIKWKFSNKNFDIFHISAQNARYM